MTEIVHDTDDPPEQVASDIVNKIERAERKLLQEGNVELAKNSLERARKRNTEIVSAIAVEYNLDKQEIKETIGYNIQKTNDDLMGVITKLALAKTKQEKTGTAPINNDTLMEIREVATEAEQFRDTLQALADGSARIRRDQTDG